MKDIVSGEFISVHKSDFDKRIHEGVRKGVVDRKVQCSICGKDIGFTNIIRHEKAHFSTMIYVTNFTDTIKVSEQEYFNIHKQNGYFFPIIENGINMSFLKW